MTHKSTSSVLRLKYSRVWSNVWCNNINYAFLVNEDIRLNNLIKQMYKVFPNQVLDFKVKRTFNFLFIIIQIVIREKNYYFYNFKDSNLVKLDHDFYYSLTNLELRKVIYQTCGYPWVRIFYRLIFFGLVRRKESAFNKMSLKSSKIFCEHICSFFKRKFRKPRRRIKGMLRALIRKKYKLEKWKVFGFKVVLSGPLNAPRGRRHKVYKIVYGQMPLNNFQKYVDYYQATGVTKHGSFGVKVWIYRGNRSLIYSRVNPRAVVFSRLKKIKTLYFKKKKKLSRYYYLFRSFC